MNAREGQTNPVLELFWIHHNQAKKRLAGHKGHQPSSHEVQKTPDEMAMKAAVQRQLRKIQSVMVAKDMSNDRCEIQLCVRSVYMMYHLLIRPLPNI
jgi:uncharacterized protein YegJ (DUF2314 family)